MSDEAHRPRRDGACKYAILLQMMQEQAGITVLEAHDVGAATIGITDAAGPSFLDSGT